MPGAARPRFEVMQWLMWQMGGLGPMLGQNGHFLLYAPEKIPYAIDRYSREAKRLYGVLDTQLDESRLHRRRLLDRRHRVLPVDHDPQGAGADARRLSERASAGTRRCARGRSCRPGWRSARRTGSRWTSRRARCCSASTSRRMPMARRARSSSEGGVDAALGSDVRRTRVHNHAVIARLDRATQYPRAGVAQHERSGILDPPLSRRMTVGVW